MGWVLWVRWVGSVWRHWVVLLYTECGVVALFQSETRSARLENGVLRNKGWMNLTLVMPRIYTSFATSCRAVKLGLNGDHLNTLKFQAVEFIEDSNGGFRHGPLAGVGDEFDVSVEIRHVAAFGLVIANSLD